MKKSASAAVLILLLLCLMNLHSVLSDFIDSGDSLSPSTSSMQNLSSPTNNSLNYNPADIYIYAFLGMIALFVLLLLLLLVFVLVKRRKKKNL